MSSSVRLVKTCIALPLLLIGCPREGTTRGPSTTSGREPEAAAAADGAAAVPASAAAFSASTHELVFSNAMMRDQGGVEPSLPIPKLTGTVQSVASGVGAITGSIVDGFLTEATNGILHHAQEIGNQLAQRLAQEVQAAQTQLRQTLQDQITRPIEELNQTMRLVADRALVVASTASAVIQAAASCSTSDARIIAATADASLSANVRDVAFWSGSKSFVAAGHALGSNSRMGLYVGGEPVSFKFVGAFNRMDTSCSEPTGALHMEGKRVKLRVVSANPRAIVVELPRLHESGTYRLDLSYQHRAGLFNRCSEDREVVQTSVTVAPSPVFSASYSAQARCDVDVATTQQASLDFGNDKCEGDKSGSIQLCPGAGEQYFSHSFDDLSRNGCAPARVETLAGGCVRASGTCPERGGIFCTGPRKWLSGRLSLTTTRPTPTNAKEALRGKLVPVLTYGQTVRQTLFDANTAQVPNGVRGAQCEWTIGVDVNWPGNSKSTAVPSRTGKGPLTSAADGISFDFNPNDGSLAISTPPYTCQYMN